MTEQKALYWVRSEKEPSGWVPFYDLPEGGLDPSVFYLDGLDYKKKINK